MSDAKRKTGKEERKGGLGAWLRGGSRGPDWMGAAADVGGRPSAGFQAWVSAMLASKSTLLTAAAAGAALSFLGFLDMYGRGGFGVISDAPGGSFFSPAPGAKGALGAWGGADSLAMLRRANPSPRGAEPAAGSGKDSPAEAGPEAEAPPQEAPLPEDAARAAEEAAAQQAAAEAAAAGDSGGSSRPGKLSTGLGGDGTGSRRETAPAAAGAEPPILARSPVPVPAKGPRVKQAAGVGSRQSLARSGASPLKGGSSLRRLGRMEKGMRAALPGSNEANYAVQSDQWNGQTSLDGAGLSQGAGSRGGTSGGTDLGGAPGILADPVVKDGTPVGEGSTALNKEEDVPKFEEKNVTPYQTMLDAGVALLAVASALTTLAFVLWLLAKLFPAVPHLFAAAAAMSKIAAVLAGAAAGVGMVIMGFGQYIQGGILAAAGGLTALLAWKAAVSPEAAAAKELAKQAALRAGAPVAGLLGAGAVKAAGTAAGQQIGADIAGAAKDAAGAVMDTTGAVADKVGKLETDAVQGAAEALHDKMESVHEAAERMRKDLQ